MSDLLLARRPVVETVLCCLALVVLAIYLRTLWPLFWVGCTAPLFLLQSRESGERAESIFKWMSEKTPIPFSAAAKAGAEAGRRHLKIIEAGGESRGGEAVAIGFYTALLGLLALILVPAKILVSLLIRYGTTLFYIWPGIKSIPENWRQCAFESSILDDVWIIPGRYDAADLFRDTGLTEEFGEPTWLNAAKNLGGALLYFVLLVIVFNVSYFPEGGLVRAMLGFGCVLVIPFFAVGILGFVVNLFPRILRAGLKASSLVWSPLIFYLDAPLTIGNDRKKIFDYYENSPMTRIAVKYSYLVILVAAGLTAWSFAKFLGFEYMDRPRVTAIYIWSGLAFLNALVAIFLWEIVIRRMNYNVKNGVEDGWWHVLVHAKLFQGIVGILMIPTTLVSLSSQLPDIVRFIRTLQIVF